jgi:hypothetical protein
MRAVFLVKMEEKKKVRKKRDRKKAKIRRDRKFRLKK